MWCFLKPDWPIDLSPLSCSACRFRNLRQSCLILVLEIYHPFPALLNFYEFYEHCLSRIVLKQRRPCLTFGCPYAGWQICNTWPCLMLVSVFCCQSHHLLLCIHSSLPSLPLPPPEGILEPPTSKSSALGLLLRMTSTPCLDTLSGV